MLSGAYSIWTLSPGVENRGLPNTLQACNRKLSLSRGGFRKTLEGVAAAQSKGPKQDGQRAKLTLVVTGG